MKIGFVLIVFGTVIASCKDVKPPETPVPRQQIGSKADSGLQWIKGQPRYFLEDAGRSLPFLKPAVEYYKPGQIVKFGELTFFRSNEVVGRDTYGDGGEIDNSQRIKFLLKNDGTQGFISMYGIAWEPLKIELIAHEKFETGNIRERLVLKLTCPFFTGYYVSTVEDHDPH